MDERPDNVSLPRRPPPGVPDEELLVEESRQLLDELEDRLGHRREQRFLTDSKLDNIT